MSAEPRDPPQGAPLADFAARVAHELRTPLASLRQAAAVMRSPHATEAQQRWGLDVIDRQAERMSRLLDRLVEATSVHAGPVPLARQRVPAAAVVTAATDAARARFEERAQRLDVSVPLGEATLDVDARRLADALAELLTNASQHATRGGAVQVRAVALAGALRIDVTDDGKGLDAAALAQVFDAFSPGRRSHGASRGKLCLGLAFARAVVEAHGGRIEAASEGPGRGATFSVHLPLAAADRP